MAGSLAGVCFPVACLPAVPVGTTEVVMDEQVSNGFGTA